MENTDEIHAIIMRRGENDTFEKTTTQARRERVEAEKSVREHCQSLSIITHPEEGSSIT
jgi:hypothetical protein